MFWCEEGRRRNINVRRKGGKKRAGKERIYIIEINIAVSEAGSDLIRNSGISDYVIKCSNLLFLIVLHFSTFTWNAA